MPHPNERFKITCPKGHEIVTVVKDGGVLPKALHCTICRFKHGEKSPASIQQLGSSDKSEPAYEWYRYDPANLPDGLAANVFEYFMSGGLFLRPIGEQPMAQMTLIKEVEFFKEPVGKEVATPALRCPNCRTTNLIKMSTFHASIIGDDDDDDDDDDGDTINPITPHQDVIDTMFYCESCREENILRMLIPLELGGVYLFWTSPNLPYHFGLTAEREDMDDLDMPLLG